MIWVGVGLALVSTISVNAGLYAEHRALAGSVRLSVRRPLFSLSLLARNPLWALGYLAGWIGWATYVLALWFAPLSLVQGMSAGGLGVLALAVRFVSRIRLGAGEWAAVVGSILALGLLMGSFAGEAPHEAARHSDLVVALALAAMVALGGALAVLAAARGRRGAGLAMLAGACYATGDVATKAAVDRQGWAFVGVLLAANCVGFFVQQLSFQHGGALGTAGVSILITNALPIGAAIAVFGESLPGGGGGLARGFAFAVVLVAAAFLAGNPSSRPAAVASELPSARTPGAGRPAGGRARAS